MLTVGTIRLKSPFIMAPMAGVTNLPFRLIVKRQGAALVTTEMVSAVGLTLQDEKTKAYLQSRPAERPLCVQLFGSAPESMAEAAGTAVEAGADIIDINLGCPVRKVVKTGAGAALLENPDRLARIVEAVRAASRVPVTAKMRAGWSPGRPAAVRTAEILEDCGADAVTIHPRFATQGYSGRADWGLIAKVKAAVGIPVVGSGDIFRPEDALRMLRETGCDGVMIARGALGNPWIFRQVQDLVEGRTPYRPTLSERRAMILEHYRLLVETMGGRRAPFLIRGLLLAYTKGLPHSKWFRGRISRISDGETLLELLDEYFKSMEREAEV
jgi:nifR3 family TIM-barrel protein